MTIGRREREQNQQLAFSLMVNALGDRAIDTTLFDAETPPFAESVLRTTWEDMVRGGHVSKVRDAQYRLTPKGWLAALELSGAAASDAYRERLGRVFAAMKSHVKGRHDSRVVDLRALAEESNEPEGLIFNIIESRASSPVSAGRRGATWFAGERGLLVEIPVDFNMDPVDIVAALTVPHLEKIQALEERLERAEEDRAQYHCSECDAEISSITGQDFPEHHAYVTYETFACGRVTADGWDEVPCPYGPNWPQLDEFEFIARKEGDLFVCSPMPKTDRARRAWYRSTTREVGRTKEEAEENARIAVAPKVKGQPERRRSWP
jgi:hypothetical protein